jgi:hypothetical protein
MGKGSGSVDWSKYQGDRVSFDGVGDKVVGKLIGLREERIRDDDLPVLVLSTADGVECEVWASQFHLQQQLAKRKPEVGDTIEIELIDLKSTGRPQPMKVFSVRVERAVAVGGDFDEASF